MAAVAAGDEASARRAAPERARPEGRLPFGLSAFVADGRSDATRKRREKQRKAKSAEDVSNGEAVEVEEEPQAGSADEAAMADDDMAAFRQHLTCYMLHVRYAQYIQT